MHQDIPFLCSSIWRTASPSTNYHIDSQEQIKCVLTLLVFNVRNRELAEIFQAPVPTYLLNLLGCTGAGFILL